MISDIKRDKLYFELIAHIMGVVSVVWKLCYGSLPPKAKW